MFISCMKGENKDFLFLRNRKSGFLRSKTINLFLPCLVQFYLRKVLSLRRLCLCCRLRRMPRSLYAPESQAGRWIDKLRAVDAANAGASQRDIAVAIFGERRVAVEWSRGSDCLRLRVQRLIREGRRMVRGGYRDLLA